MVLYNGFITIGENVSKAAIAFTTATTDLALPHFASMVTTK